MLYPYRSLPAAGPTDCHSPPCQCDGDQCGAKQALSYCGPYTRDNGLCTEDNTCDRGFGWDYDPDDDYDDYGQPFPSQNWHYGSDPAAYYPYVTQYNMGWQTVPAN